MVKKLELPSERARKRLAQAEARAEKAAHQQKLAEARLAKWDARAARWRKKLEGDYAEKDRIAKEKYEEARTADAMKVAMGIKRDMHIGKKHDSFGKPITPILRSGSCIQGYHGICRGRRGSTGKDDPGIGPCHCVCHNSKGTGKVVTG